MITMLAAIETKSGDGLPVWPAWALELLPNQSEVIAASSTETAIYATRKGDAIYVLTITASNEERPEETWEIEVTSCPATGRVEECYRLIETREEAVGYVSGRGVVSYLRELSELLADDPEQTLELFLDPDSDPTT
jgi:hypothetical protein